jgi:polygalacturonase
VSEASVTVESSAAPDSATAGIQEAIDRLPAEGGSVHLPPGRYLLRRSVHLRSNVRLRGDGPATVLVRPPPLHHVAVTQETNGSIPTLHVATPAGLHVGDQVYVRDDENAGWWATHAIIRAITGGRLDLEILHGEARFVYKPERNARLTTWFPALWLRKQHHVTMENLTIDGGVTAHPGPRCDFVVAAVHAHNADNVRVQNVSVRNWSGDGIGVQGGKGSQVSGCLVENCAGHGYHPGTSITQSVWSGNIARGNTRDGLFFCVAVTHTVVSGNVFVGNDGHGIGGLSDPDCRNVVVGNVCAENGGHGIDGANARANVIQGNLCRANSRRAPGRCAGIYLAGHRDCAVTGNLCFDDQETPTQPHGLVEESPAGANIVANNLGAP